MTTPSQTYYSDQEGPSESSLEPPRELQRPRCGHVSSSTGAGCMAYALKDSTFCFYHDPRPEIVAKRRKALMKGAKKTNTHDGLSTWTERPITTMQELKDALSELFNAGMGGEITTARLSALASVANALGKVIEGSDLEKRIEALEIKAGEMGA